MPQFFGYLAGCGISRVGLWDPEVRGDAAAEYCITVKLLKRLPEDLTIPDEFDGVRVFKTYTGELYAL